MESSPQKLYPQSFASKKSKNDPYKKPKKFNMVDFSDKDHINRLGSIFNNINEISYAELIEELKRIYGVGTNISKQQILPYLRTNRLIKQNKNLNYTL